MPLDEMTRRNLELVESLRGGGVEGTLLSVLDRTGTPMGARLLRQWVLAPLTDRAAIDARLDAVATLVADADRARRDARRDRRRARRRTTGGEGRVGPKHAARAARARRFARRRFRRSRAHARARARRGRLGGDLAAVGRRAPELASQICATLVERPPIAIGDDATIATGVDAELDTLRDLRDGGKDAIARIQADERTRTGISSLKVGFNKVFGYYIEVTNAEPAPRAAGLSAPADDHVGRALRDAGAQGVRGEGAHARPSASRARERELFEALRTRGRAARSRASSASRAPSPSSTC